MDVLAEPQTATISEDGAIAIPTEMLQALGIHPGTRVLLRTEGTRIILQPMNAQLVDVLRGRFAGGPSMADELQRERRAEDKKW
jgi:AbrB family looped-hinge helix DNA binding protein